jgi:hypothetical protein
VLGLACIGAWLVIAFFRYRVYFKAVNALLARTKFGSLYDLPNDEFMVLDDVVKRCYFSKTPAQQTVDAVLEESVRYLTRR